MRYGAGVVPPPPPPPPPPTPVPVVVETRAPGRFGVRYFDRVTLVTPTYAISIADRVRRRDGVRILAQVTKVSVTDTQRMVESALLQSMSMKMQVPDQVTFSAEHLRIIREFDRVLGIKV